MPAPHVICAAPDPDERERLTAALRDGLGVDVVAVTDPAAALRELDAVSTRALVSAPSFPDADRSGLELLAAARDRAPDVACLLVAEEGSLDPDAEVSAVVEVVRPDQQRRLVTLVTRAIEGHGHAAYPLPEDEPQRVAALSTYPTDDDRLAAALDRLADLAAGTFGADYAHVSAMFADEQEHVGVSGIDHATVPREGTICAYTLADGDVTVIPSVPDDPRFEDYAGVDELDLGWYAGVPVTVDGRDVGTFCVLGSGELPDIDGEALSAFAAEAADQFEFAKLRERTITE